MALLPWGNANSACILALWTITFICRFHFGGAAFWGGCANLTYCNGHGECVTKNGQDTMVQTCACWDGWGSAAEEARTGLKTGVPDCSRQTCQTGHAWADLPTGATSAHAEAECSAAGTCDRERGECNCFDDFTGSACQIRRCPGSDDKITCSGHGRCLPLAYTQHIDEALPLSNATQGVYKDRQLSLASNPAWDAMVSHQCVCDSSWGVGLGEMEFQEAEYFGPDCSLRRCPSGKDPIATEDSEQGYNVTADGGHAVGLYGNKRHSECSNQGICDYEKGECECFPTFEGIACERKERTEGVKRLALKFNCDTYECVHTLEDQPTSMPTFSPPTMTPTLEPTATPTITSQPTTSPMPSGTPTATPKPSPKPSPLPTLVPTLDPTRLPTLNPTRLPSLVPSPGPSVPPTHHPTSMPTLEPTPAPSIIPTGVPSIIPTGLPTLMPTLAPTALPTLAPTSLPTLMPTLEPTAVPTRGCTGYLISGVGELRTAVGAWCSDEATATTTYGAIGTWCTRKVTNMSYLFSLYDTGGTDVGGLYCSTAATFNVDISAWDLRSVTNVEAMFYGAAAFNQDISAWDISQGTQFTRMFYGATAFSQALSWTIPDGADVTDMFTSSSGSLA